MCEATGAGKKPDMPNQEVLDRSSARAGTAATVSRANDALAETLAQLMLWLIPALAFLLAILR